MPTTFASDRQFLGIAPETTEGTAVAPTATFVIDKFQPEDKPVWLKDQGWRGHLGDISGMPQGVIKADFTMSGPAFADTLPHLLVNILGDRTTTGGADPFSHAVSLLNTGTAQPKTHTFTHFQGPPATNFARTYAGVALSELTIKWDAASTLVMIDAKGQCWPSAIAGAAPTASPSTVVPLASWRGLLGIAGPASGGTLVSTVQSAEITIKRNLEDLYTLSGLQTPYHIQRGEVGVTGKLNFVAADESPYLAMINNTQPQLQFKTDNGTVGAGQKQFLVDIQNAAYETAKYNAGKNAVEYDVTFAAISNSTNAGASGLMSPIKVTVINGTAAATY